MSNNNQNEYGTPIDNDRSSSRLLPRFFRTTANINFLQATVDQLVQPGVAEKLSGYIGRVDSKALDASKDNYLGDVSNERFDYQFEPSVVIKDNLKNVNFYADYNDYVYSLSNNGSYVLDESLLNSQESYPWNPNIDWDKFTNFREYYWLPNGPETVPIRGQSIEVESTYTIGLVEDDDNFAYVFTPNGFTRNPTLTLYRGQTYRFEIDTPGHPIAFAITRSFTPGAAVITAGTEGVRGPGLFDATLYDESGSVFDIGDFVVLPSGGGITFDEDENVSTLYPDGIAKIGEEGEEVATAYIEKGTIEFTIPLNAPDRLFYVSKNDVNTSGQMRIYDIEEASSIDVENEILGKKTYKSENRIQLTNGMKVRFQGQVTPEKYAESEWYVEGVGSQIKLIDQKDLIIPAVYSEDITVPYDSEEFDRLPYSNSSSYPLKKDYIVSNRASPDKNAWSRYNRWFHISIINQSAKINKTTPNLDQSFRAKRPIIEFKPGLKLYNFGTEAKNDVDLVDDFTTDVFSTIEGSFGYNIDGIDVADNMRILFTADTDILVKNKIYQVKFITIGNDRQISLIEAEDTEPQEFEVVLVTQGNNNAGKTWYFDGENWKLTQQKEKVNQPPLFDLCCPLGNFYNDNQIFNATTFKGNKVFSYKEGEGTPDTELGFPLTYKSIENTGDIVFDFNLLTESWTTEDENSIQTINSDTSYLRKYKNRTDFDFVNGWSSTPVKTKQYVKRNYISSDDERIFFEIDAYDFAGDLNDLKVVVYVDHKLQVENIDYAIDRENGKAWVRFITQLDVNQHILIKTESRAPRSLVSESYYELPINWERNPRNQNVTEFTLGEVVDHVDSMIEELSGFNGTYPGKSNLRDFGDLNKYGKRFIKHSGPTNLSAYHIISQEFNVVKALETSKDDYSKFKRIFIQTATESSFSGTIKQHVDHLLEEINRDKVPSMPYYFSDMVPYSNSKVLEYEVLDSSNPYFAVSQSFNPNQLSNKAVNVYLDGVQLLISKDYGFTQDGFAIIYADRKVGDILEVHEYDTTDGSYIPPTPTKLGLYPAYEPEIFIDDTYRTPTKIIQGHDGSRFVAFNDYRDDLILELEKRIYNNIKQKYNPEIFDINDYVGGFYRDTKFEKNKIENPMLKDFTSWLKLVEVDYTQNPDYIYGETFTYNYSNMSGPDDETLPGFWRGIYKQAFDTDRPHTHPWEMLGFTIKPSWWNEVYGPAPYTNNNLILWEDLQEGLIREPNKLPIRNSKYARPGLVNNIPVDDEGKLSSPLNSRFAKNYIASLTRQNFKFGDHSPAESAWRNSSEFPFALIKSYLLNNPNNVFSKAFDISRVIRNKAGQLTYSETGKQIELDQILFPNTYESSERTLTSGLVDYVYNFISSYVTRIYENYINDIKNIKNQMGFKLGGFTDKDKLKLILDSRTPYNQGNVFVPEENYQIFLNKSAPLTIATYSGVVIEKTPSGYTVKGYNLDNTSFTYYEKLQTSNDPVITVGGISEPFIQWQPNKRIYKGQVVEQGEKYFRATANFTTNESLTTEFLAQLPQLPIQGGKSAIFRKSFNKRRIRNIEYGTFFESSQEVVDFLLGYGEFLKDSGFQFEDFNNELNVINDWDTSAKEFLFWTTQNWASGTVLSVSPSANHISFEREFVSADDIFNDFFDYGLCLNADSRQITSQYNHIERNGNSFNFRLVNTEEGCYHLQIPLVQKEHVVLLDNKTQFNDVIYEPSTGYRQERIKVVGYRSTNWNGTLNAPGFVFDEAKIVEWETWKDYSIGSIVKYKEFYYVALYNLSGSDVFNTNDWQKLQDKPDSKLLSNFDYKAAQFADFYDLDSDNFDSEQQRFAQHLIGYQNRQYLSNIINDDVSQYKFYQGMIADKGTKNSITKLFDALNSADKDSLDFYEEWALEVGRYGATEKVNELEIILDEDEIDLAPQPIELLNQIPSDKKDKVYRQQPHQIYEKPEGYNSNPFPTIQLENEFVKTSGWVRPEDVKYRLQQESELNFLASNLLTIGDYVWVTDIQRSWNVFQYVDLPFNIIGWSLEELGDQNLEIPTEFRFTLSKFPKGTFSIGDYISVPSGARIQLPNFYKIIDIEKNEIVIEIPATEAIPDDLDVDHEFTPNVAIAYLRSVRTENLISGNELIQDQKLNDQKLWIENYDGNWKVIENQPVYNFIDNFVNQKTFDSTFHKFGEKIAVTKNNKTLAVGSPGELEGRVYTYKRTLDTAAWVADEEILPPKDIVTQNDSSGNLDLNFGKSLAFSPDGEILAIGSPGASDIKTKYEGLFNQFRSYNKGDIVKFKESIWKAKREILPATNSQIFSTFSSFSELIQLNSSDSTLYTLLYTGEPELGNKTVNHFLVRPQSEQYLGTKVGDKVSLNWNVYSSNNPTFDEYLPFDGNSGLTPSVITDQHVISEKVDEIFYISTFLIEPNIGDRITTPTGSAEIVRVYTQDDSLVLYVNDVNGNFDLTGILFVNDRFVIGEYTKENTTNFVDGLGGLWLFEVPPYNNGFNYYDVGRGLVVNDIILEEESRNEFEYYNTLNKVLTLPNNLRNKSSQIINLTYEGNPYESAGIYPTKLFAIRASTDFDNYNEGELIEIFANNTENSPIDFAAAGFSEDKLNQEHTIKYIWDGFIDFEFSEFDFTGFPFELNPRYSIDQSGNITDNGVGDIIIDKQIPFDEFGGLSLNSYTTSVAEVLFYQRDFNNVRVYIRNISGTWAERTGNIARYEIEREGNYVNPEGVTIRPGEPNRVIGVIDSSINNISLSGYNGIGKLIVIENETNLPRVDNPEIVDIEYSLYRSINISGIDRLPNYPFASNKDWAQLRNIPVDEYGTSKYNNEGVVSFYRKVFSGSYEYIYSVVSENRTNNRYFGDNIEIRQQDKDYSIYISSRGDTSTNTGSIELFKHGYSSDDNYLGKWNFEVTYTLGDIVIDKGVYYQAVNNVPGSLDNPILLTDNDYWQDISFRIGKDNAYRGEFDSGLPYSLGDIVYYVAPDSTDKRLYRAQTNIPVNSLFNDKNWLQITNGIDYIGYLPNNTGLKLYDYRDFDNNATYSKGDIVVWQEKVYQAINDIIPTSQGFNTIEWALLPNTVDENVYTINDPDKSLIQFGKAFDISQNSEVMIVSAVQQTDSTPETVVLVYRKVFDKYYLDQVIKPEVSNTGFAHSVSLSNNGEVLVISEPFDDTIKIDQGKVHIYTQIDGDFVFSQTLNSPNQEEAEQFGYTVYVDDNQLAITSINGDSVIPTTFDNEDTTFDNNFTTFNNILFNSGIVYLFENLNNKFVYAENLRYNDPDAFFLGENLLVNNNHVYLGMPRLKDNNDHQGVVLNYRKHPGLNAWKEIRTPEPIVDIDKIDGVFLYNKRTGNLLTYLDYIDPVQGKIAGPAQQELTYITRYDPAKYNVSVESGVLDERKFWTTQNVGKLWWDISTAKFIYSYQGDIQYQSKAFGKQVIGTSIDVYEWVESDISPSEWDILADTEDGLRQNISGSTAYGDSIYSVVDIYDKATQLFTQKYYFWVKNKVIVPNIEGRSISSINVTQLIADPAGQGYRHVNFLSNNRILVHNINSFLNDKDVVLNIKWKPVKTEQNLHAQYYVMSEGLETSQLPNSLETKWFDSLIGYDSNLKVVPDNNLSPKYRYGNKFTPRQSMFVNKEEALKQVIERANLTLKKNIIVDLFDISRLFEEQEPPTSSTGEYDITIDIIDELRFVGTSKVTPAKIKLETDSGKIVRAVIEDPGRGYNVSPSYKLIGTGSGAELSFDINNLGQIINVNIINSGDNYEDSTSLVIRPFSVLVKSDSSVFNKWSIYRWDSLTKVWSRYQVQEFNTKQFWTYEDWYAEDVNQFTNFDYVVDESFQLQSIDDSFGDIVKINNIGSGGWLLLRKIADVDTEDYTINYETIGRENGTIQLSSGLYDFAGNAIGYDNRTYDSYFYDSQPIRETRIILETLRDNLFIGDLRAEYNNLWFSSLRYMFTEQVNIDWAFKTSFVKVKHNLGDLDQPGNFKNNTLPSYIEYVNEVKPYKTNVREFVSSYENLEPTNTLTTDFDLPPLYNESTGIIVPNKAKVLGTNIVSISDRTNVYPRKNWLDNVGYGVKEIKIADPGSGYIFKPKVTITGGGGTGATAEAYIGQGKITEIKIINPGSGYITQPTLTVEGSQLDDGTPVKASIILGNGLTRTPSIKMKFDRLSGEIFIADLSEREGPFYGTAGRFKYNLKWPLDLRTTKVKVLVNSKESLRSEYTYRNIETESDYDKLIGQIEFTNPPENGAEIYVEYYKPLSMLSAADRIHHGYNPTVGMFGKIYDDKGNLQLGQLMDGVDYGGVEVRSFDFSGSSGYDTGGWFSDPYDTFDATYEDEVFSFDGSTISIELTQPLEDGVEYNIYKGVSGDLINAVRIDDPNFGTAEQTNENAILQSIIGDGTTTILYLDELGIIVGDGDLLVIRKTTSDGSVLPDPNSYDVALSGGDLTYQSAQGINAEEIIVDGDGFVTPTTSKGPEELVPGQIVDTLDIKVYHRDGDGQGVIYSQSYKTDGSTVFDLGVIPSTNDAVLVKIDNNILDNTEYKINWDENTIVLNEVPEDNLKLNIITVEAGSQKVLDTGKFVGDGNTFDFLTNVLHNETNTAYVTLNGNKVDVILSESDDSTTPNDTGKTILRFETAPEDGDVVNYIIFYEDLEINYSQITKDYFDGDGSTVVFDLSQEPLYKSPTSYNTIVQVDNKILNPGYNKQYIVQKETVFGNFDPNSTELLGTTSYALDLFQQPPATLLVEDVEVYLNGIKLTFPSQWRFDVFNNAVELVPGVAKEGDILELFVVTDGQYTIKGNSLEFATAPSDNSQIQIYRFTNHDILNIERINYDVVARNSITPGTENYVTYNKLTKGVIDLRYPTLDVQYVWVSVNGELLSPTVDYILENNKTTIKILEGVDENDVVDIIQFAAPAANNKFAFRQFKDMLNRTHYKRLDSPVTKLSQDLNIYDLRIEVEDGSQLPEPNKGKNIPGIIFIEGERIEYLVKEGNTLRQLRRQTLGTGAREFYVAETNIYDQSTLKNIPYKDKTIVQNIQTDGTSSSFDLDFTPNSVNEFEVFVGGRRLRKTELQKFDNTLGQDSPNGDIILPAEFTVENNNLQLIFTPEVNQIITIVRKIGELWTPLGKSVTETQNDISTFLRAGSSELLE